MKNIYEFVVKDSFGDDFPMEKLKGKVLLIVNTASKCGFTPQFQGLENLYNKYKDQDFLVLAFPCNQFGSQDPGTNEEIRNFCKLNYGVTFPVMEKVDVNGEKASPLFDFLKEEKTGFLKSDIKWNFTKFLVDRKGQVVDRFAPTTKPEDLEKKIERLL